MGDHYDRYWRSRDYSDDDRRGGGGEGSRRTRFDKYRVTGMLLLFFGIAILALGIFDIGWTTSRYGDSCQPNVNYPNLCPGNHIFVYIGSPLWGGAMLICAAFLALSVHPDKAHHHKAHRHFLILIGFNMVIILPAIIVLNILEIFMNKGSYWMYNLNGQLQIYDNLQFGLPIAIVIMAGMALNVVLFFCVFLYCCAEDKRSYQKRSRRYQGYDGPEQGDSYRGQRIPPRDPYRYQGGGYPGYGGGYGGGRRYYYN